jgi:DNA polymerase-4
VVALFRILILHSNLQRKIIHVDMDCFYAAVEIRDDPTLQTLPVAVGGHSTQRGVLCTCNYIAREYGIRSAMPTAHALRLCKDLVVIPVNMQKYRDAAKIIHNIFREFTDLVEPLSLDEAYLDVTNSPHCQGSATLIAKEIRQRIFAEVNITASAGVAPNKFLAKIASGWKKPNGLFVIRPQDVADFIKNLPVKELHGVGKVTAEKLHQHGFKVCADFYKADLPELTYHFGKLGLQLYNQSRGIDNRTVEPNRIRKSLSVEETFTINLASFEQCELMLGELYQKLIRRFQEANIKLPIKNYFIKIKYSDFKKQTIERMGRTPDLLAYQKLLSEIYFRPHNSIRLLGLGFHFETETKIATYAAAQQCLL